MRTLGTSIAMLGGVAAACALWLLVYPDWPSWLEVWPLLKCN